MIHQAGPELIEIRYPESPRPSYSLMVRFRANIDRCVGSNFKLGFSPKGVPGRQVSGGTETLDLFGWLNAEPAIISRYPIPDERPVVYLELGDVIVIAGHGSFLVAPPVGYDHTPQLLAMS